MNRLQKRIEFKNNQHIVTYWKPTGNDEEPYKYVTGSVFNHRNKFIRKVPAP